MSGYLSDAISFLTERKFDKFVIPILSIIVGVYDVVTYPLYWLVQQPGRKMMLARQPRAEIVSRGSDSITYQSVRPTHECYRVIMDGEINTLSKLLHHIAEQKGSGECMGTRQMLAEEDEVQTDGRIFKKYVMGDYTWRSYYDVETEARNFGQGLIELGLPPRSKVVIFAETRAEWYISAFGCFENSMSVVTMYTSLGEEALIHGINETEATFIVTTHDLITKLKDVLPKTPQVTTIVYIEDQLHKTDTKGYGNAKILPYQEVCRLGEASLHKESHRPGPDEVAIIMYTSGSTGTPKGVELSHRNITTAIAAIANHVVLNPKDSHLYVAFLPLAHVLELIAETYCMMYGVKIGYSSALTLLDTSSKVKKGCKGDVTVLRPTLMAAVPLILDRIHAAVMDTLEQRAGNIGKAIMNFSVAYKVKWHKKGFDTPILNRLVFRKIRDMMGGRLTIVFSGGAPISAATQEFTRSTLCVDVLNGYGLTETSANACIQDSDDVEVGGRIGGPLNGGQIKLVNWEEGNYRVDDKPNPRGEIVLGGGSVAIGYFKRPDETREEFFDEGSFRWFRTGDIGEVSPEGIFKIIDRKKDLVKLPYGEYVSLGKVELVLRTCPLVEQVCVYGESSRMSIVALVVPSQAALEKFAAEMRMNGASHSSLCSNPDIIKAVLKELQNHGKNGNLEKFEIPSAIHLLDEIWTPESGLLTAAFKLKRRTIQDRFQKEINDMYVR